MKSRGDENASPPLFIPLSQKRLSVRFGIGCLGGKGEKGIVLRDRHPKTVINSVFADLFPEMKNFETAEEC